MLYEVITHRALGRIEPLGAGWVLRSETHELTVPLFKLSIGRGPLAHLHLPDDSVSRRHSGHRPETR